VVECLVEDAVARGESVRVAVLNPVVRPSPVLEASRVDVVRCSAHGWNRVRGFMLPVPAMGLTPEAQGLFQWADVIQAHHPLAQAVGARLARAYGTRLVAHVHNMGEAWMNPRGIVPWLFAREVRRGLRAADQVLCVGEAVRQALIQVIPDVADRAIVQLNPLPAWLTSLTQSLAPQYDVVVVGRLDEQKNSAFAAEVVCRWAAAHPSGRVAIVGEGPLASDVDAIRARYGVTDRVVRLGWLPRPEAVAVMADSRVLFQPSRYEGSPITVREALTLGLRVVASNIPPHLELAETDSRVWLAPADGFGATELLAHAIVASRDQQNSPDHPGSII